MCLTFVDCSQHVMDLCTCYLTAGEAAFLLFLWVSPCVCWTTGYLCYILVLAIMVCVCRSITFSISIPTPKSMIWYRWTSKDNVVVVTNTESFQTRRGGLKTCLRIACCSIERSDIEAPGRWISGLCAYSYLIRMKIASSRLAMLYLKTNEISST